MSLQMLICVLVLTTASCGWMRKSPVLNATELGPIYRYPKGSNINPYVTEEGTPRESAVMSWDRAVYLIGR